MTNPHQRFAGAVTQSVESQAHSKASFKELMLACFAIQRMFTEAKTTVLAVHCAKRWWHKEDRSQVWVYSHYTYVGMAFYPLSMILWPHNFTTFHSLGFIAPLHSRLIISLPLSAKSSYLFCCHFITGSSYQAVQDHVTVPNLSQVPILLIRDNHEMGYMVYSRSLMLEKVQSPLKDMLVTFWILG